MILETQNPAFGFYGTIESGLEDAERAWEAAFEAITDATDAHDPNAFGPDGVRNFLDSRLGRHFADAVLDAMMTGLGITDAVERATKQHMAWTIGQRTEREDGIPAGLPYLTGWVQHFAIEAEAA